MLIREQTDFRPGGWSGGPEQSAERRMFCQNLFRFALPSVEVTYNHSPAKQGMVGPGTGKAHLRSSSPDGLKQLRQPAEGPADQ